jgi:DNA-binding transcriptional ArsR family regulator
MTDEKFILVSMEDSRSKKIADALGNKTCRKLVDYLAEKNEASAKDISDELKIPLNTLDYNLKLLLDSEIIEKKKNFFWSKKGKKIAMYGLSNKSIIISPKSTKISSKLKSLIPPTMLVAVSTFAIWAYNKISSASQYTVSRGAEMLKTVSDNSAGIVSTAAPSTPIYNPSILFNNVHNWIWFLAGSVLALIIFSILNWRKL